MQAKSSLLFRHRALSFMFHVMEYIVLSLFLKLIIISWEGECVPRLALLFG